MIPVVLDPSRLDMALIGRGDAAARRVRQLREGGARHLLVFSPAPDRSLIDAAGDDLYWGLPKPDLLRSIDMLWIVGLDDDQSRSLAQLARSGKALVNVEDRRESCDFHSPAQVRRGDLLLAVSTNGRSPGLAARVRSDLERRFGDEWADRLDHISHKRDAWKNAGHDLKGLAHLTNEAIDREGWFA